MITKPSLWSGPVDAPVARLSPAKRLEDVFEWITDFFFPSFNLSLPHYLSSSLHPLLYSSLPELSAKANDGREAALPSSPCPP